MKTTTQPRYGHVGADEIGQPEWFAFSNGDMYRVSAIALKNGASVISMSAHPFTFSDGSILGANEELASAFTLSRETISQYSIKGMNVNQVSMVLNLEQQYYLEELCKCYDIVIIPFPVLVSLKELGIRGNYMNAVAFNATPETQRSAPNEKIIDINNWSY